MIIQFFNLIRALISDRAIDTILYLVTIMFLSGILQRCRKHAETLGNTLKSLNGSSWVEIYEKIGAATVPFLIENTIKLHDIYLSISERLYCYFVNILVMIHYFYTRRKTTPAHVVAATMDGVDITRVMIYFYKYDTIHSCGSLYRWLLKFGYTPGNVEMIYAKGDYYKSIIDIENDIEILTGEELPFGSINLETLPGCMIFNTKKVL